MRQYTNKEQTQHLIELGFPRPNYIDIDGYPPKDMLDSYVSIKDRFGIVKCCEKYSIGELLSILDGYMTEPTDELLIWRDMLFWYVRFASDMECSCYDPELVNALYKYIVELKEE